MPLSFRSVLVVVVLLLLLPLLLPPLLLLRVFRLFSLFFVFASPIYTCRLAIYTKEDESESFGWLVVAYKSRKAGR